MSKVDFEVGGVRMLPVKVNAECKIIDGALKNRKGTVVAFDYLLNEVTVELDDTTRVITVHENIEQ